MIEASSLNGIHSILGDFKATTTCSSTPQNSLERSIVLKGYPLCIGQPSDSVIPPVKKPRTISPNSVVQFPRLTPSLYTSYTDRSPNNNNKNHFPDLISGFEIQQRLVELNVKEKSLIEERQLLTDQLTKIRQNQQQFDFEISTLKQQLPTTTKNGNSLKRSAATPLDENVVEAEVLSVLSPSSQKVLQKVLKDQELKSLKEKIVVDSNDSPFKPRTICSSKNRRQSVYIPNSSSNSSSSSYIPVERVHKNYTVVENTSPQSGSDGEQSEIKISPCGSPPEQKPNLAITDPKSYSSLQKLSRRVKIVMKPSGQIFPRPKGNEKNSLLDQDRNSPTIQTTTVKDNTVYTKPSDEFDVITGDNWLPWDDMS